MQYERAAKIHFGPAHSRGNRISYDGRNAITIGPTGPIFVTTCLFQMSGQRAANALMTVRARLMAMFASITLAGASK